MPSADRRTAGRAGNLCRRRTVWHDVVAGVPGDATWPARPVLMLLGPVSVVIGVLAAMLPAPILTGDTAAIAAVAVPLLASLAAAASPSATWSASSCGRSRLLAPARRSGETSRRIGSGSIFRTVPNVPGHPDGADRLPHAG